MMAHAITEIISLHPIANFAADVRAGLTKSGQKELSSNYLYDALGSALFNAITELPEYGLFRADERILREHADEIVHPLFRAKASTNIPENVVVAELGSGRKTRGILEAPAPRHPPPFSPIEISPAALAQCVNELSQLDRINVIGI